MAPESLFARQSSNKSDMWSFGVTLFEILCNGKTPYQGISNDRFRNCCIGVL